MKIGKHYTKHHFPLPLNLFFFFENDVQSEWYVHRPYVSGRLYTTQTEQFLAAEAAGTFNAAGQDGNSNDGAEANCAAVRVGLGSN